MRTQKLTTSELIIARFQETALYDNMPTPEKREAIRALKYAMTVGDNDLRELALS